ncbi:PNPH phosphorylase, partial [Leptocoma aspasia]|nr:PNPH phosphorylase [Leptocoma aspasia]
YEACLEAARWLRARLAEPPRVALVCGSGLGALAQELRDPQSFLYSDIPHFPRSTVQGHAGRLVVGRLGSTPCAVLQGRFHLFWGTNGCFEVRKGQFWGKNVHFGSEIDGLGVQMDTLGQKGPFWGTNGHLGAPCRFGPRFPAMTDAYDPGLRRRALALAPKELRARPGVYVGVGGPSYETPAECRLLRRLGADAVGMSTVSEASAARHLGLRVLGLSLITN